MTRHTKYAIKGQRIGGAQPHEGPPEAPKDLAPRTRWVYLCERGHGLIRVYAADAIPPAAVDCRCGGVARLPGAPEGTEPDTPGYRTGDKWERPKDGRTPLDRVRERRSEKDLDSLLAERMAAVRESGAAR